MSQTDETPPTDSVVAWQLSPPHDDAPDDSAATHYVLCTACIRQYIGDDTVHPIHESVVGRVLVCRGCRRNLSRTTTPADAETDAETDGDAPQRVGPPACQSPDCTEAACAPDYTYCTVHQRDHD